MLSFPLSSNIIQHSLHGLCSTHLLAFTNQVKGSVISLPPITTCDSVGTFRTFKLLSSRVPLSVCFQHQVQFKSMLCSISRITSLLTLGLSLWKPFCVNQDLNVKNGGSKNIELLLHCIHFQWNKFLPRLIAWVCILGTWM